MKYQTEKGISKINLLIDRIEQGRTILTGQLGEEVIVDTRMLPKEAIEGESIIVTLATEEADARNRDIKAKEILNEILGNNVR